MSVLTLTVFSLIGMGLFIALSAALYSSLPRVLLESAERHGRFHGLEDQDASLKVGGTPSDALPQGTWSSQSA